MIYGLDFLSWLVGSVLFVCVYGLCSGEGCDERRVIKLITEKLD